MYFLVKLLAQIITRTFFKNVTVLGKERIPLYGPVLFVGNHMNQFVDAAMLISIFPRHIRFLMAEVSFKLPIIGTLAQSAGCISVQRPQDLRYAGIGGLIWNNGTDTRIRGIKTRFKIDLKFQDTIIIEDLKISRKIVDVISDNELIIDKQIDVEYSANFTEGYPFFILPKIDQSSVYEEVNDAMRNGNAIGIFPEGGSHDRTTLLPLKPGVALMALTSMLEGAEDLLIVPVGLNYYEPHKSFSSAVVEVGQPIPVTLELAQKYEENPNEAVKELLSMIEKGMNSVLLSARDYTTLNCIRLCVQLYPPDRTPLSQDNYYLLHQLFSQFFWALHDDPELEHLRKELCEYEDTINHYGVPDKEVWQLKQPLSSAIKLIITKFFLLILVSILGGSFFPLWAPIRYIPAMMAERHRKKALANSKVKIRATDVLASFRILVIIGLLPSLNLLYGILFSSTFMHGKSFNMKVTTTIGIFMILPPIFYLSRVSFEMIMPLTKNIRTLFYVVVSNVNYLRGTERTLIHMRTKLQQKIRALVYTKGPQVSQNFVSSFATVVPDAVIHADNKRINNSLGEYVPVATRAKYDPREEIL
ncbi:SCT1/Gpt2p-like glycerol-3-phosphate acyltransferase signal peptide plus 3 transmembrane domain [Cryptosporidium ryanae]|uniref:SCT1/Gpt2p-like glycerol-3-phosphate acyltransferase signal peptide plus 3 transmembrane domain n=1 Tax=Cryptosporidium ryanae TaxID=515981 RepID=UPI00351A7F08|nr:SCT1/Gpt2p-like glycerol-3-phosphate acyltransferase signal peptide plus 3 transmembrane domain [Cryptosporidium ryanae]